VVLGTNRPATASNRPAETGATRIGANSRLQAAYKLVDAKAEANHTSYEDRIVCCASRIRIRAPCPFESHSAIGLNDADYQARIERTKLQQNVDQFEGKTGDQFAVNLSPYSDKWTVQSAK